MHECVITTPIGPLRLVASEAALVAVEPVDAAPSPPTHPVLAEAARELDAWFRGELRAFETPLAPAGTPFQAQVWAALARIPFGETRTYAELAASIGRPGAARAVGAANARNPLAVVIPCHRVVGADGALTGYAWGLDKKRWLLDHERRRQLSH